MSLLDTTPLLNSSELNGHTNYYTTQDDKGNINTIKNESDGGQSKSNQLCPESQFINYGEEDQMEIYGYSYNAFRTAVIWLLTCLSFGILRLLFHWYPHWMLFATHNSCALRNAEKILFVENYQGKYKSYFVKNVKTLSTNNISSQNINTSNSLVSNVPDDAFSNLQESNATVRIYLENGTHKDVSQIRAVWCKKLCYFWDNDNNMFLKLVGLDHGLTNIELHQFKGFSIGEQLLRRVAYGNNEIEVPIQTIPTLLLLEVLNPFYIFQVFTLAVWFAEGYYYYTVAIILMSVFGITSSIIQTRRNQINLRGTVQSTDRVTVCRGEGFKEDIPSVHLVPGDVIIIPPHGCVMHCDAVLLNGNCIVNESMLTGESVPVTKTPLPKSTNQYNVKEDTNHTLYCGTKVIQTRFYGPEDVRAVVLQTGYLTAKGQLVRSIMYPPPADFKFESDSYKFIGILAVIATLGFIYTLVLKIDRGISPSDIAIKALDIITIVIPPALPAAMTVGKLYAQSRLKKSNIYCINSRVINVSGSINCVCFDKTGTLTEDGLDMWGVVECTDNLDRSMKEPLKDPQLLENGPLLLGMVSCHSLTIIEGEISGDPLDLKMFESTGWILEEPDIPDTSKYDLLVPTVVKPPKGTDDTNFEMGVIHQYQFSSRLQRMSVICKTVSSLNFEVFCKGSPEVIISLSKPESVPSNITSILKIYTEQGYRVIAIGHRVLNETSYLKIQKMSRSEAEEDLTFAGLIVLENRLKPATSGIINTLKEANIKVVMITGDNIQTAISVAKECGIIGDGETVIDVTANPPNKINPPTIFYTFSAISSTVNESFTKPFITDIESMNGNNQFSGFKFAMTGSTWAVIKEHFSDSLPRLITRGVVFARMSSDQKQQLVQHLQGLGYYVAMCGDGANDCGALKAAHAGISLSEAESSVASPFTAKDPDISCVPRVIKEGRAALVTSFGIFKFMVAYSLTEFLSVAILYAIDSNLTDLEFLFIDICLIVNFAFFFGKTEAYKGPLFKDAPMTSLLSFLPIFSLIMQMTIMIVFQCITFYVVTMFPWYVPFVYTEENGYKCFQNYAVYCVSMFQYITLAIVFAQSKPYRQRIYTNAPFCFSLFLMTAICTYITVYPANWVVSMLQLLVPPTYDIRLLILALAFSNFIVSLFAESFILEYLVTKKILPKLQSQNKSLQYLGIEKEILGDINWPPIVDSSEIVQNSHSPELEPRSIHFEIVSIDENGGDNLGFVLDEPINNMTTKF